MRRRDVITLLGGAAFSWPLALNAQQPTMPVVGVLNSTSADGYAPFMAALHSGLAETGFMAGRNVAIEYRWAEDRYDRLPALAAELVSVPVAVLVANGPAAPPAKAATTTIPIVFTAGFDPIELGLVASLNRPGGNLTGVSILNVELGPKRLELMRELVPEATDVGVLINPTNPNAQALSRELRAAASTLRTQIHILHAQNEREIDAAFAAMAKLRVGALVVGNDPFFTTLSRRLAAMAVRDAIPAIYQYREFVSADGLMSYGASLIDVYRQAGIYAGRILKGEKPADLPVQQSTKVELMINLKTAKALGLTVPLSLLGRADEVIE
jgi:putative tryptophan/tyrosine transport system substrate-binding protein